MKISFLAIFIFVTRVFSRDIYNTEFTDTFDSVTEKAFEYDYPEEEVQVSERALPESFSDLDETARKVISNFESRVRDGQRGDDIVLRSFLYGLKSGFTEDDCMELSKKCCSILETRKNDNSSFKALYSLCPPTKSVCERLSQFLLALCQETKAKQESNTNYDKKFCKEHWDLCCDLKDFCKDILAESCKKVQDKCLGAGLPGPHPSPPPEHSPAELPVQADFTKTHTILSVSTVLVTELAPETHTYTKTYIKTKTCCLGRPTKTEEETLEPEPTVEEEEPTEEEEEPTEEEEKPAEEEEKPTEEEEKPTEEEEKPTDEKEKPTVEGGEPTEEEEEPTEEGTEHTDDDGPDSDNTHGEEETEDQCSITETVTVTVTPEKTLEAAEKGHGVRVEGFQKEMLICAIIGMTLGVWIIL
ncbi:hypothetical protein T552_00852 [Pneumocystis carinii B80]|uniref:Uncharacterized protein n=1 Tax=Pneumocystis carinii (strain B80) TaxID=1408658 RepID=A0A0W4ZMN9_PNEC8|nr:hypothetical protein T552_00852 [Pneumocystis carinii B80]KTW29644.1 hypothetical protein T552_00852 [Pneumocystis carinii B80]